MRTEKGDLVQKARTGEVDVIVHGCNCFCTMGAGIAKTIKQVFPTAFQADLATVERDKSKLGGYSEAQVEIAGETLVIVNAYTQYQWRGPGRKVDYNAVRSVFRQIKQSFSGKRIAYPAIGAGSLVANGQLFPRLLMKNWRAKNTFSWSGRNKVAILLCCLQPCPPYFCLLPTNLVSLASQPDS